MRVALPRGGLGLEIGRRALSGSAVVEYETGRCAGGRTGDPPPGPGPSPGEEDRSGDEADETRPGVQGFPLAVTWEPAEAGGKKNDAFFRFRSLSSCLAESGLEGEAGGEEAVGRLSCEEEPLCLQP